jgi:hypothetical protein
MITANSTINIRKVLSKYDTVTYSAATVHLEVTNSTATSLVNSPTVIPQVANVSDGYVLFNGVPLAENGNKIRMFLSSVVDLDTAPVLTRMGNTYVRRLPNSPTEIII